MTAIDWFLEELENNDWYWLPESIKNEIINQAKEIEKKQRISDYYQGACDESDSHGAQYICESDAEKWYTKTFKSE